MKIHRTVPLVQQRSLAAQRHLLPRLWLIITLSAVVTVSVGALWWERQLPKRLREALDRKAYAECIQISEQLAALRWLGDHRPNEQALCRQLRAEQLWRDDDYAAALSLQRQLVRSGKGDVKANRNKLTTWEDSVKDKAVALFQQGEFEPALMMLKPLLHQASGTADQLRASFQEIWNRNRLERERLDDLIDQQRWWEALDSLNRLDHPWWQAQAKAQREQVEATIAALGDAQEHHQHPADQTSGISAADLEQAVQTQLKHGVDPWNAFEAGCRSLGGLVIEDGPESFCRRP